MKVNINENDYMNILSNNDQFWPQGVHIKDSVPYDDYNKVSQWKHSI